MAPGLETYFNVSVIADPVATPSCTADGSFGVFVVALPSMSSRASMRIVAGRG